MPYIIINTNHHLLLHLIEQRRMLLARVLQLLLELVALLCDEPVLVAELHAQPVGAGGGGWVLWW